MKVKNYLKGKDKVNSSQLVKWNFIKTFYLSLVAAMLCEDKKYLSFSEIK